MNLTDYRTLGRSGLVVSPLALGTMTFGVERWGSGEAGSRGVFNAYVEAGGNFVDTADVYAGGRSEEMLGAFVADGKLRDRLVLATKAGFSRERGNPQAGGNGAKNIRAALEGSLRRLRTDHVDLFWTHVWDGVTPAEEVLQTLGDLIRAGKIRHFGLSNAPAWYVAKMATLAAVHGVPGPIALQLEYSLVERGIEPEHLSAAREFGLGLLPWSPLAGGFLTGKYDRESREARATSEPAAPDKAGSPASDGTAADNRLDGANPFGDSKFTERNWRILDALREVAVQAERPVAQVALAWVMGRPGVSAMLMGASRPEQLADNISALDVVLSTEQRAALDSASLPAPSYPAALFSPFINRLVFGGRGVGGWRG